MVHEYVSEQWQFGISGSDLAGVRSEGSAESLEGGWRRQLGDLELGLLGNKLAFQIYSLFSTAARHGPGGICTQCSCLPVRMEPGGGTELVDSFDM